MILLNNLPLYKTYIKLIHKIICECQDHYKPQVKGGFIVHLKDPNPTMDTKDLREGLMINHNNNEGTSSINIYLFNQHFYDEVEIVVNLNNVDESTLIIYRIPYSDIVYREIKKPLEKNINENYNSYISDGLINYALMKCNCIKISFTTHGIIMQQAMQKLFDEYLNKINTFA